MGVGPADDDASGIDADDEQQVDYPEGVSRGENDGGEVEEDRQGVGENGGDEPAPGGAAIEVADG